MLRLKKFRSAFLATVALIASSNASAADTVNGNGFDWNRMYGGVTLGWGESGDSASYNCSTFVFCPGGTPLQPISSPFPASEEFDEGDFLGGVTFGMNRRQNDFVFGLEGDISWTDWDDSGSTDNGPTGALSGNGLFKTTVHREVNWFATLRGRAGAVVRNALVYATGGAAFADVDLATSLKAEFPTWSGSTGETMIGWTVGGGVELPLSSRITIKGEALYYDLGDISVRATPQGGTGVFGGTYSAKSEVSGVVARAGINLSF